MPDYSMVAKERDVYGDVCDEFAVDLACEAVLSEILLVMQ